LAKNNLIMSKTTKPPSDKFLKLEGIRFVPTNCYSPNHWAVKHIVYPFGNFDTREEYDARRKAALANQIAVSLENNGLLKDKDVLIPATLRLLGFTNIY
jgi:hypothetical protein